MAEASGNFLSLEAQIAALIGPSVDDMGYTLVQVKLLEGKKKRTLQVMAERKDGVGMGVADCTDISRALSAILDVEDPISGHYDLEVSSPGIDRPLINAADFARYAGFEAKFETLVGQMAPAGATEISAGRKRFKGVLQPMRGEHVVMVIDGVEWAVPLAQIVNAKLVLTDALVQDYLRQEKQARQARKSGSVPSEQKLKLARKPQSERKPKPETKLERKPKPERKRP